MTSSALVARVVHAQVFASLSPSLRALNPHLAPTAPSPSAKSPSALRPSDLPALSPSLRAINPQLADVLLAKAPPPPHRARWMTDVSPLAWRTDDGAAAILRGFVLVSERNQREAHEARRGARVRWQKRVVRDALARIEPPCVTDGRRWEARLTRGAPRAMDSDNLVGACKAVRDAVAAWLGVDDGPRGPVTWTYRAEDTRRDAPPFVRLDVLPLPLEAP